MKLQKAGIDFLEKFEGCVLHAYRDQRLILTIGYGHTSAAGYPHVIVGMTISQAMAEEIFFRDIQRYEDVVNKIITKPMLQHEFDAFTSLCYNIGTDGFEHSQVSKAFNLDNKAECAQDFLHWANPHSLLYRREKEKHLFETGEYT